MPKQRTPMPHEHGAVLCRDFEVDTVKDWIAGNYCRDTHPQYLLRIYSVDTVPA